MVIFLTNGRSFLGPYSPDEMRPLARGRASLRADDMTTDVYQLTANTIEEARRTFRAKR